MLWQMIGSAREPAARLVSPPIVRLMSRCTVPSRFPPWPTCALLRSALPAWSERAPLRARAMSPVATWAAPWSTACQPIWVKGFAVLPPRKRSPSLLPKLVAVAWVALPMKIEPELLP